VPEGANVDYPLVNGHALVVDGGLIGGRLWSEVQQRREMFRATLGLT
jgi:hypothetical protein